MEKQLKDYIHFYIGCRCLNTWFSEGHPEYDKDWRLNGTVKTFHKPYFLENKAETTWTDSIKPILRKISDMQDDEAIELARLVVHKNSFTDPVTYKNEFGDTIVTWNESDPWGCGDLFNATGERTWSADQFHYLLKQGFDLFQLIDNQLAVDEKTLTK